MHPLQGITIKHSEEVKGKAKDRLVMDILKSPDVRNVFQGSPVKFSTSKAIVMVHTLDTGNTLISVGIPTEKGGLIYYELAEPLVEQEKRYKSQAMLLAFQGETVKLISTSVNGRLVSLSPSSRQAHAVFSGSPPCGGCQNPVSGPWEYELATCTSWNSGCLIGCGIGCGVCAIECIECAVTANPWACAKCIGCALGCGYCVILCCQHWESTYVDCGNAWP